MGAAALFLALLIGVMALLVSQRDHVTRAALSDASTSCDGASVKPGDDVQARLKAAGTGATVCFAPGTYRLASALDPLQGQSLRGQAGVVLTGAVPVTGWTKDGSRWWSGGVLPADYTDANYSVCEDERTNPCHKAERLFRGDYALAAVTSLDALTRNTFYSDYGANRVYVADDPTDGHYELSRARAAVSSSSADITVSGFVVEKFATLAQHAAVEDYGPRWTVTGNELRFNHGGGLKIVAAGADVKRNDIHHNGQEGLTTYRATDGVIADNVLSDNNTDGFWRNDGESGGLKLAESSRMSIQRNVVEGNRGIGVWADIDCDTVAITDNAIADNAADGIRYEISYRGKITGNTLAHNGFDRGRGVNGYLGEGGAITVNTSQDVTIRDNDLWNNDKGVALVGADRGAGTLGTWNLSQVTVAGNTIDIVKGGSSGLVEYFGDDSYFTSRGITFSDNRYQLIGQSVSAPVIRGRGGDLESIADWQRSGQDGGATLAALLAPTTRPVLPELVAGVTGAARSTARVTTGSTSEAAAAAPSAARTVVSPAMATSSTSTPPSAPVTSSSVPPIAAASTSTSSTPAASPSASTGQAPATPESSSDPTVEDDATSADTDLPPIPAQPEQAPLPSLSYSAG